MEILKTSENIVFVFFIPSLDCSPAHGFHVRSTDLISAADSYFNHLSNSGDGSFLDYFIDSSIYLNFCDTNYYIYLCNVVDIAFLDLIKF